MRLFGRDQTARKRFVQGTHRTRTPAETLAAYMPLMESFGITRIAGVTGLDYIGMPVYAATRPLARSISSQQGKGIDAMAAKASALMEAIEVWHGENIVLPLRYETMRVLARTGNVLDPAPFPSLTGDKLDPDRPTFWVEGWELFLEAPVWVPFELVHINFVPPVREWRIFAQTSNGLASGNCQLEAAVHAVCEVIERDATALWFLDVRDNADKESQLDLATLDADNQALIERIQSAGLLVGVYDSTSDIGIPSYQAIVFERPQSVRALGYFWGHGCHLHPSVAVARAITESVQCRAAELFGAREDIQPSDYGRNRDDAELAEMQQQLLTPPPKRALSTRASLATDTFEGDLEVLRDGLRRVGIKRGALVDLSRPEFDIAVVKAVIPDLEGKFGAEKHRLGPRGRHMQKWSSAQRKAEEKVSS